MLRRRRCPGGMLVGLKPGRKVAAVALVDVLIIVFVLALAAVGSARGLIGSALPLAGFVVGAAVGGRLGPELLADGEESAYAPVITVLSGVTLGAAFAIVMEGAAFAIRARWPRGRRSRRVDAAGGAVLLGGLGALLAWAFGAAALHTPGPSARELRAAVQDSQILGALNDLMPPSGPLLNVLRRIDPTPAIRGPEARVGPPSPAIARDPDVNRAGDSVVKVLGTACGLGVEGSGWVAGPDLVVTNAHVIAGQDDTTVTPRAGAPELDAEPVFYRPANDLALLSVPGLGLSSLPLAAAPGAGTPGATLGYPENGPFAVAAARLGQTGEVISEDSYGRGPVRRLMTPFRGDVRSGNSGGPVVDATGQVLATVFAAQQGGGPPSGLGIPNSVVRDAIGAPLAPVDTGPCSV
jgi:S1-C subfamily serine protease